MYFQLIGLIVGSSCSHKSGKLTCSILSSVDICPALSNFVKHCSQVGFTGFGGVGYNW
jgi:hypothetical protein